MPIRRKIPPRLSPMMTLESLTNELNRTIIEIYEDINIMQNKLSLYLNMLQDSQSGTLGSLRLTKKATSDKNENKYQLLGKGDKGWILIVDDVINLTEAETLDMEVGIKNVDTEKPRYATRTKT